MFLAGRIEPSKLGGGETRAARLAFAGGAFTPPLTKGVLRPFGNPSAETHSSPLQAVGHSEVLRRNNYNQLKRLYFIHRKCVINVGESAPVILKIIFDTDFENSAILLIRHIARETVFRRFTHPLLIWQAAVVFKKR